LSAPRAAIPALRASLGEGARYLAASAVALVLDFGAYVGLIRLAGVDYLLAAPIGFTLGIVTIYALSVRWVFATRRLADARLEFALFAGIGVAGLALNQGVVYAGVEWLRLSYELAKLASAAVVFGFNFLLRKLALFTRYR
jgi:putative flippase GtrA